MANQQRINFRYFKDSSIGIALNEACTESDIEEIIHLFAKAKGTNTAPETLASSMTSQKTMESIPESLRRTSPYLEHPVFKDHHSETLFMRYVKSLENKDLSLTNSMIPLGSCTMKLNSAVEMTPITWEETANMHPFAPKEQAKGYLTVIQELEFYLKEITGFSAVSFQPNSGAQGEYTGLMLIRAYHKDHGEGDRDTALIPVSAHGTNPASAVMAGMQVVLIDCDQNGNIDINDLRQKCEAHKKTLSALMVTYPSTHGIFEENIQEVCKLIHDHGGLVYMDGANMNAQVGITNPALIGADVCHLNLHKTFAIPHGGGGPGMGPIAVNDKLKPYLPDFELSEILNLTNIPAAGEQKLIRSVAAAPFSSASILLISHAYISLMGKEGLKAASQYAILNANYIHQRLEDHYSVLFTNQHNRVAHELIIDLRTFKKTADIEAEDIAKRLIDYGFHAPTLSWPVMGTMMIEPTESESKAEIDRFCEAMISIRCEIKKIEEGVYSKEDNPVKNAPHTCEEISSDDWSHAYSRQEAVYPLAYLRNHKYWPPVGRIDNAYGDRNLMCTCAGLEAYASQIS